MPTYDYVCKECGHAFEEFQTMTADPLVMCPACGKASLRRMMGTGAGMVFKGSGFYLTDYKKGGSASSPAPATPAKTESKADSGAPKTAPAAEKKSDT